MAKPLVAIVGRPNVGKSTLVNRLAQTRQAIVDVTPGVTRDRNYVETDWRGRDFLLVDTGGIEVAADEPIKRAIKNQALAAVEEADLILFVVDGRDGVTPGDQEIAEVLRPAAKPVLLVVNKLDQPDAVADPEFYQLGVGDPVPVSAGHGLGIGDLLDAVTDGLPHLPEEAPTGDEVRVAIVGRPNAGKSSLFNAIIGAERAVVSEVPGTTRDAIDTIVERDERRYRLIDTAGLRRIPRLSGNLEYYGILRAMRALDSADVAVLVIDGVVGVTEQDQRIAALAGEKRCALVLTVNKWDLLDAEAREQALTQVSERLHFVGYAPVVTTSAATAHGLRGLFAGIDRAVAGFRSTIKTSQLNRLVGQLGQKHLPSRAGKALRLKYATQLRSRPPGFLFFVNDPKIVDNAYRRYVEKALRKEFNLVGTPVSLYFRKAR